MSAVTANMQQSPPFSNASARLRVGSYTFANESQLSGSFKILLFGFEIEFVHLPDYYPWMSPNGQWAGALAHL